MPCARGGSPPGNVRTQQTIQRRRHRRRRRRPAATGPVLAAQAGGEPRERGAEHRAAHRRRQGAAATNAVRHGLTAQACVLPGEDPDELDELARGLEADLRPIGAAERELVGRVVSLGWRLRRVARAEAAIWEADDADRQRSHGISSHLRETFGYPLMPGASADPPAPATGPQFVARQFACPDASALERLAAYEQRLDRALHAALRQFQQLRKMRGEEERDGRGERDEREDAVTVDAAAAAAASRRTAGAERSQSGSGRAGERTSDVAIPHPRTRAPTATRSRRKTSSCKTKPRRSPGGL